MTVEARRSSIFDVYAVLLDDEIWSRITDDNSPSQEDFRAPWDTVYISGYVGRDLASLLCAHEFELGVKAHFQVLKPFRLAHARDLWRASRKALDVKRVYVEMPEIYMSAINFAKHMGFSEVARTPGYIVGGVECARRLMIDGE